jgi:hypothetical protein
LKEWNFGIMANVMRLGIGVPRFMPKFSLPRLLPRSLPLSLPQSWSTPWVIERAVIGILSLSLLGFALSVAAELSMQSSAQQVGKSVKPIIAADRLGLALSTMDAQIAATALDQDAHASERKNIDVLARQIVEINRVLGQDEDSADSLGKIVARLWTYFSVADDEAASLRPAGAVASTLAAESTDRASTALRGQIIPEAQRAAANAEASFQTAVATYEQRAGASFLATLLPCVSLLAMLLVLQVFLARRTHRLINVPMATASLHLTVFLLYFLTVSGSSRNDLLDAKNIYFGRLQALYATAMDGRLLQADQAIWLSAVSSNGGEQPLCLRHAASFKQISAQMLDAEAPGDPGGESASPSVLAASLDEADQAVTAGGFEQDHLKGVIGTALRLAVKDPPKWSAIGDAARGFIRYRERDAQIRALAAAGNYAAAAELRRKTETAEDGPLTAMNTALDKSLADDEAAFQDRIIAMDRSTSTLPFLLAAVLTGAILLSSFGLWQRHQEYR